PENFPVVTVGIVKARGVHEAVILRGHRTSAAVGEGLVHQGIYLGAALTGQRQQCLVVGGGIAEGFLGEGLEELLPEQHHEALLPQDPARGLVVGEPPVELEAELGEELLASLQVSNSEVDEDLTSHVSLPRGAGGMVRRIRMRASAPRGRAYPSSSGLP